MKESIGYTATLNIAIIFIVIIFAVFAMSISYYRAYKVSNKITESIEKYEGYNYLAEEEIKEKLAVLGYNHSSVTCNETLGSCTLFSKTYNVDELDEDITPVTNSSGELGYCVYTCPTDKEDYVSYKVTTNMMWNIPIIDNILNIPVETKTREIYGFGNVLSSYEPVQETPCNFTRDNDRNGVISKGDGVSCKGENFYVVNIDESQIQLLAVYNLNVGQNIYAECSEYIQCASTQGSSNGTASVDFLDESLINQYLEGYATYLRNEGVSSANAQLLTADQASSLGCSYQSNSCLGASRYSWVYSTSYWLATSDSSGRWLIYYHGGFYASPHTSDRWSLGIRPLVTISTSEVS